MPQRAPTPTIVADEMQYKRRLVDQACRIVSYAVGAFLPRLYVCYALPLSTLTNSTLSSSLVSPHRPCSRRHAAARRVPGGSRPAVCRLVPLLPFSPILFVIFTSVSFVLCICTYSSSFSISLIFLAFLSPF